MFNFLVEHPYKGQERDELSIEKGDIICNCEVIEDGWMRGTLRGTVGLFPDNFGKVIQKSSEGRSTNNLAKSQEDLMKPFDKPGKSPQTNNKQYSGFGDIIAEDSMRKQHSGLSTTSSVSIAPFSVTKTTPKNPTVQQNSPVQVKSTNPTANPTKASPSSMFQARALYTYNAENNDELDLEPGDIVDVLETNTQDDGWWKGQLKGRVGVFPDNFVERLAASASSGQSSVANSWSTSASNGKLQLPVSPEVSYSETVQPTPASGRLVHITNSRPKQMGKRKPTKALTELGAGQGRDSTSTSSMASNDEESQNKRSAPKQLSYASLEKKRTSPQNATVNTVSHKEQPSTRGRSDAEGLQENYVTRREYQQLQDELELFRNHVNTRIHSLTQELDEERKQRLNTQREMERMKRFLIDLENRFFNSKPKEGGSQPQSSLSSRRS